VKPEQSDPTPDDAGEWKWTWTEPVRAAGWLETPSRYGVLFFARRQPYYVGRPQPAPCPPEVEESST